MDGSLEQTLAISTLGATRSREWMHRVISLVETAVGQLHGQEHPAQGTLLEAASLLRRQVHPPAAGKVPAGRARFLTWQARKVRDYVDSHITGPILGADLGALIQRPAPHFSQSSTSTLSATPPTSLVRR